MTVYCHPFRVKIDELVTQINRETRIKKETIKKILSDPNYEPFQLDVGSYQSLGANHKNDRVTWLENKECREKIAVSQCAGDANPPKCIKHYEKKLCFTKPNSISEAEVMRFVYQVARFNPNFRNYYNHSIRYNDPSFPPMQTRDRKVKVALALYKIYFGTHPLYEQHPNGTPNNIPPHEVSLVKFYKKCVDGDTCTVSVLKPEECMQKGLYGYYGSARENQVDSAEACPKICLEKDPETNKCIEGYCVPNFIPDEGYQWTIKKLIDPSYGSGRGERPPKQTKFKYVDNCTKIFREMILSRYKTQKIANPEAFFGKYDSREVFQSIRLIAAWHDYVAEIDKTIMNDFVNYVENGTRTSIATRESTVRFASKDTPAHMTGIWTPYGVYLRRLTLYLTQNPWAVDYYGRYEFPKTLHKLTYFFQKRRAEINALAEPLKRSNNEKIKALAESLSADKLPRPIDMFASVVGANGDSNEDMQKFFARHPDYINNWTLRRVLWGALPPYQKYRSNEFPVFKKAGRIAEKHEHGIYGNIPTETALRKYHSRIDRYKPKDSLTGRP